jgi:hypothetical protein
VDYCKGNEIQFFQAYIIKDISDEYGKPSSVNIFSIKEELGSVDEIYRFPSQRFCTDKASTPYPRKIQSINKISDLPYCQDYKEVVDQFLKNVKQQNNNSNK